MKGRNLLDEVDKSILRILSDYEQLTPLQVWYELGEDDAVKERTSEEEILTRLESLRKKGFVESVTEVATDDASSSLTYRVKRSDK